MATWRTIATSEKDAESPITTQLIEALDQNPYAIAEQAADAPILQSLWHPYDSVAVGDANDGVFWDYSVDGALASLESPALADGYDYALRLIGVSLSGGTVAVTVEGYLATTGSWQVLDTTAGHTAPNTADALVAVTRPRIVSNGWGVAWGQPMVDNAGNTLADGMTSAGHATAQKLSKLRLYASATTFDAGKVALYRRRCLLAEY